MMHLNVWNPTKGQLAQAQLDELVQSWDDEEKALKEQLAQAYSNARTVSYVL